MGNFVNKQLEKVRQRRQNTEKRGKLVKIERKKTAGESLKTLPEAQWTQKLTP